MKLATIVHDSLHLSYGKVCEYATLLENGMQKKQAEKTIVLALFNDMGFANPSISYKTTGQPYLENASETFISISHAEGYFAVAVADHPIGIDIQSFRSRIGKGSSYFINENESQFLENENDLHLIWCAKEAFYKLLEGKIADLRLEVSIQIIDWEQSLIFLEYLGQQFRLEFKQLEGAFLVYTL